MVFFAESTHQLNQDSKVTLRITPFLFAFNIFNQKKNPVIFIPPCPIGNVASRSASARPVEQTTWKGGDCTHVRWNELVTEQQWLERLPSKGTNISPKKWNIWVDDFQFPQVGYVFFFLEGILFIGGGRGPGVCFRVFFLSLGGELLLFNSGGRCVASACK